MTNKTKAGPTRISSKHRGFLIFNRLYGPGPGPCLLNLRVTPQVWSVPCELPTPTPTAPSNLVLSRIYFKIVTSCGCLWKGKGQISIGGGTGGPPKVMVTFYVLMGGELH